MSWRTIQYGYERHSIQDERGTEIGFAHRRKDAHLIAAAPELYALVEESLFHLRLDELAEAYHHRALAALDKARGEQ